jgi:hypothetical protein
MFGLGHVHAPKLPTPPNNVCSANLTYRMDSL